MSCTIASNIRYFRVEGQQQPTGLRTFSRNSDTPNQVCGHLLKKGKKNIAGSTKVLSKTKPEFEQYIRSRPRMLSFKEQERLKNAAKNVTAEERLDALVQKEKLTKRLNEQTERSREYFRSIDEEHLKSSPTIAAEDVLDNSDQLKKMDVAFIAKQEQEEEIRAVNRYILHAKSQAIRDIQMNEKKERDRKKREEDIRTERKIIDENAKAMAKEGFSAQMRKERNAKYAEEIRQQLIQRETLRLMESERAEVETRIAREANVAIQREEEQQAQNARTRQALFRSELDRVVEMSNLFKKMLCEQEREAELHIQTYTKEKREQEEQLKRKKKLAREEFERKQQILYQLAQKRMTSKSKQEELNFFREQERAEREYRRREKESAMLRKKLEDDIMEARHRQMQEMKTRQALQIAREENSFNSMIESLKKEEERMKKQEEEHKKRKLCYRAEITKQMKDKAEAQQRLRDSERIETSLWRKAESERQAKVSAIVNAKISAMRSACFPESYIKDIERLVDRLSKKNPTQM